MRGAWQDNFTPAKAMQIAQIRSNACKYATGAVTGTSSCDAIFMEKWDTVKENSHKSECVVAESGAHGRATQGKRPTNQTPDSRSKIFEPLMVCRKDIPWREMVSQSHPARAISLSA
jgi:hypothetical protein